MATVRWTKEAEDWLIQIYDYVAEDDPAAAARTIEGILERAEALHAFPLLGYRYPG